MFRCFSLLGVVAVALGVAALASASPQTHTKKLLPPKNDETARRPGPRPVPFVRVPGLAFHASLSAN